MGNPILFLILAAIAIAAALGMLLSRNAVHSALFLVLNFVTVAIFTLC
jgi:NADH-quinone oxidoreductase subunit J